jgi:site-specific DNA recombinase
MEAIEFGPKWFEEVLALTSLKDEVERIKKTWEATLEKLRRMARSYIDGLFSDAEYHRLKRILEMELESLVIPEVDAAREAGKLIIDLPKLWASANATEKRRLILSLLDAI